MDIRLEAYACLGQIGDIVHDSGLFVENRCDLTPDIVRDLDLLGELGRKVRDYYNAYKDISFARDANIINRAILLQISGWYSLPEDTYGSVINCHRYLLEVAEKSGNIKTEDEVKQDTSNDKEEKFAEYLRQSDEYKKAVSAGKIVEPFTWTGTKVDLARWLSPLVPQLPSGGCDWSHVDNIFTINDKIITSKDLAKTLSKTDRKQLDW